MDLSNFFNAKNIAIIGVSKDPRKIGHVIFRNLIDANYQGNFFLVNPFADIILNKKVYHSLLNIKENIDLAIIAVPAKKVPNIINECGKKKIHNVIIISSFNDLSNIKLEQEVKNLLEKYKIKCIGVNSLGIYNAYNNLDTLFLPRYRLKRPKPGSIAIISQSGSICAASLELAIARDYGISKLISYGNATNIDESDVLEYLAEDKETKVICMYIEQLKDGQKFLNIAKKISKVKPIIVIKAGTLEISPIGKLLGQEEIYFTVFKQANVIKAETLEEMFNFARILEKSVPAKGNKIQIITNGSGYGMLAKNAIIKNNLALANLNKKTLEKLNKQLSNLIINNVIDLGADANTEKYKIALEACLQDDDVNILLLIIIYQTPLLEQDILNVITELNNLKKKPIIVVSIGGEFADNLRKSLEEKGIISFIFPDEAVRAIKALTEYYTKK